MMSVLTEDSAAVAAPPDFHRYVQLGVLVLTAGCIYPLVYLRQNFEGTMLEAFDITATQLGQCYSMLGVLFVATYLPSGWLADHFKPRNLMAFSLAGTGLLGVWYMTLPPFAVLQWIFAAWGVTTGLTFWATLIKQTNLLAGHDHQGRFFGILEGGRGVVEAVLASVAVTWFAWTAASADHSSVDGLQQVMLMYVAILLIMSVVTWFSFSTGDDGMGAAQEKTRPGNTLHDAMMLMRNETVWLAAICIFAGYSLFYATYSFAGFLGSELGLSAAAVGYLTLGRQWMRPVGGIVGGFLGDWLSVERVLGVLLLGTGIGLAGMALLPASSSVVMVLLVVMAVSLMLFAVRGIYWGTLDACGIPAEKRGFAIGVICLVGYSPEMFLPLLNGYLVDHFDGRTAYLIFFGGTGVLGLAGSVAAFRLMMLGRRAV